MNIVSLLFKLARLGADVRSVTRSIETGSPTPIVRRLVNKGVGRKILSKFIWRG